MSTDVAEQLVLRFDDGPVATLMLNRPEKLNALTPAVFEALRHHLDALASDASVGCVVLAGAGRSFCAGHDLEAIAGGHRAEAHFEAATIDALEALPNPTIARIHGHCLTGGLELALGCDLLLCSASAVLGDTHGQWGLVPVWGMSVRLPERVGASAAKELMFTSRRIDGRAAAAMGLVDRCIPDDELDVSVRNLAEEISSNSRGTNRIAKALLRANRDLAHDDALRYERSLPYGVAEDRAERLGRRRTARS
jgi:enoyl-CoA hydratase